MKKCFSRRPRRRVYVRIRAEDGALSRFFIDPAAEKAVKQLSCKLPVILAETSCQPKEFGHYNRKRPLQK
jgi:hypothetical protein